MKPRRIKVEAVGYPWSHDGLKACWRGREHTAQIRLRGQWLAQLIAPGQHVFVRAEVHSDKVILLLEPEAKK